MRMESKYVKRRQRGLAVLCAALVLLIGAVIYIGVHFFNHGESDYSGSGNGTVKLVQVEEGSSLSELGPQLSKDGIVASNDAFQSAAFNNPRASQIKPGFYRLQEEMSAEAAVNALLDEKNQVEVLNVQGGSTLMDSKVVGGDVRYGIYTLISQVTCAQGADNCISAQSLQDVAAQTDPVELGVPEWAIEKVKGRGNDPRRLEGLIVPGQYVVDPSANAKEILKDLIQRSAKEFEKTDIVNRAQVVNLSPYDLLTAASLIEREAPANDFDKVARVILNRLAVPQRLEFDSTVNYDLPEQEVATTDADRARLTPWNTYTMDGLPTTPIASVSVKAIEAMEKPAEGQWLYFVTVDKNGTTVFSNTFEEHLAAIQQSADNGVLDSNR
ncbi:endolytic transglycosylase MltG [Corynebacterium sp. sy017]|uniref:endolytic transglycosylase MltG n=1 Tax=unclassified Corynebacterium TaxID=2624378 RepID=UPI001185A8FC|nr:MULTISPECIES: endolytic transglycosylase MltG [unclassified Corynebacterium]MBP3087701.1 endolytic transglycosylase MltG [Corynebacterium sp. sy017]QDZ42681.1 endolytic transglycosylase MltG [Corynebacterium sp. sy039]TSD92257.1 endolytic transglycosylase MltG [Corynebacterium sp. SY003]